jgi:hypothetical protein
VYGAVLLVTEGFRAVLPGWIVVMAGVAGVAAMVLYLLLKRPALREELTTWRN